jgi:hypothetical protein
MSKLVFKAIGFGGGFSSSSTLHQIAAAFGGSIKSAIEPQELTSAFLHLIPQVYQ